jgi:hypothetical protein
MRIYKIRLAALVALAFMALTASSTSAQVSVTSEPGGVSCGTPSVFNHEASGGCEIHVASTELFDVEVFGAQISRCDSEFEIQIGSNGAGWLTHQTLTGAACAVQPCREPDGGVTPWQGNFAEVGGWLVLNLTFCVQGSQTTNCNTTVPTVVNGHVGFTFSGESPELMCAGTSGLLQAHVNWASEYNQGIEISH